MMNRITAKLRESLKVNKSDGFKFAVTLIVAFSTIAYNISNYLKNNPISEYLFYSLATALFISVLIIVLFCTYITIKAISMEVENSEIKKKLDNFSSQLYLTSFWFIFGLVFNVIFVLFISLLSDLTYVHLSSFLNVNSNFILSYFRTSSFSTYIGYYIFFSLVILVPFSLIVLLIFIKSIEKHRVFDEFSTFIPAFHFQSNVKLVFSLLALSILISATSIVIVPYFIKGEIITEMDNVYSKKVHSSTY